MLSNKQNKLISVKKEIKEDSKKRAQETGHLANMQIKYLS